MALAAAVVGAAGFVALAPEAQAATTSRIPAHVFAPYFEAYNGDSLNGLSQQSGNNFLTLAFVQTASAGSCTALWNGTTAISSATFGADITAIRARGGDVIPSFGGYAADNGGTELADSCTSVDAIAAEFQRVITTYDVTRIDLDIEDNSLNRPDGIDRRNKAVKKVEDWAAATGRLVQFTYTLPTTPTGLAPSGLAVLQNAAQNQARIDIVNIMTFDYYDGVTHDMAAATQTAATGLVSQLKGVWPGKTDAQYWNQVGIIEMNGQDDYANDTGNLSAEVFTLANATTVTNWAKAKGIGALSFWALQRDNGGCPGQAPGERNCSGVAQSTWQFSQLMRSFTSGATSSPTPSASASSASPSTPSSPSPSPSSPSPSVSTPAGTAWAAGTAYKVGQIVTYNGKRYQCRQAHTAIVSWEPPNVLALWLPL
ncbi:chitinase [Actinoplanes awajinensis subsp. mycoplanecinus]|uniref:chitinase n=1 Tax=Actinoplanes awajinensis subsp. mycoplanecinus TaxID=135947 RepID=A0A101J9G8_9ACTN|nr:chitinase [Actinoplanes awajinensis subsp. mycoplanecinus]